MLAITGRSFREVVRTRPFLGIVAGSLVWVFGFGWDVGGVVFGTSMWPVTHLIAGTVLSGSYGLGMVISLLIAVYAGELIWREREEGMGEIVDSTPIPDWVPFAGKFLALSLILLSLQALLMAAGVLLQTIKGYYDFELGLYLRILFGLQLADYLLLAALAMLVHVIVDQKYLAHLIVVLFYLFTLFAGRLGIEHNLLIYGADPGWVYSDLSGFGPDLVPYAWFKLYWAGWALLFALFTTLFWVRGRESGARQRIQVARERLTRTATGVAAAAAALIVILGGFIFYNTNVLNDYRTAWDRTERRAEYERRYKRYESLTQPRLIASELRIEIYPDRAAADMGGTYRLLNASTEPIGAIHLLIDPVVTTRRMQFDRPTVQTHTDEEHGYRIYSLEQSLQPGDSLRIMFDLELRPRGFPNSGINALVVSNGTYFDRRLLPVIGYQPDLELTDADTRAEHGLPPRPPAPPLTDPTARQYGFTPRDADWVELEVVIGTVEDQTAVAPGTLRRSWTENGRRYFHYGTDAPVPNSYAFLSARYEVLEDRWNDVEIQILHHPTHDFNVDRMLRGVKASLDYNTEQFGPYPHRQIRIVEFPRHAGSYARSHPGTVTFSEGSSFITRVEPSDVDRPFFVTAHEVAHQWWGNQVASANLPGAAFLTETLAQYSAMMVMEKTYGREQIRRFLGYELDRYLRGRSVFTAREVPLISVEDQPHIHYNKGAVVMYALRDYIGEEQVNAALRAFLEEHRFAGPPYPTSIDLYRELRTVTPDSLHYLLVDLFAEVTLWDLRLRGVDVHPAPSGEYRVTLDIEAYKLKVDSIGNETRVAMDDLIEIGVFAAATGGDRLGEPLYLRKHRIGSGVRSITVSVPRAPAWVGIDPYHLLIDRQPDDNLRSVGRLE